MLSFWAEWACIQATNSMQILLHYAKKVTKKCNFSGNISYKLLILQQLGKENVCYI